MKKNIFKFTLVAIAILFAGFSAKATIITVSNAPVTAGMYTKIQDAADAAKAGDTLYIHPSLTPYGDIIIKKRLTLIGGGYRREEAPASGYISQISTIIFDENLVQVDGSKFMGIHTTGNFTLATNTTDVDNIIVERCQLGSNTSVSILGDGWILRNNVFGAYSSGGYILNINNRSNIIIANNIIRGSISLTDKPSVLILNNFFIGRTDYFAQVSSWHMVENAIFANNIFLNQNATFGPSNKVNNNVFNKNAFIRSSSSTFTTLPGTNTGAGNLFTTLASFQLADANMILTSGLTSPPFNKDNWTFDLSSSSPGKGYGTDGTDIGIYGGAYPMPNLNGIPNIPFITELNILNSVLPATDDLEFNVKAKSIK